MRAWVVPVSLAMGMWIAPGCRGTSFRSVYRITLILGSVNVVDRAPVIPVIIAPWGVCMSGSVLGVLSVVVVCKIVSVSVGVVVVVVVPVC